MLIRSVSLVLTLVLASASTAKDPTAKDGTTSIIEIPLDSVWANFMPGTVDLHTLEPSVFVLDTSNLPPDEVAKRTCDSYINRISEFLEPHSETKGGPQVKPKPRPAFVVEGTGKDALQSAAAVFESDRPPAVSFNAGKELTLVFFSFSSGSRVQLTKIERQGSTVKVFYRFFVDGLTASTSHLALIPLGILPAEKYNVTFVQTPMGSTYKNVGGNVATELEQRTICQPFSFSVEQRDK